MGKGQETRERIIARAAELFNMRGYGGTAISDVMQAVNLEKGGIYRHFASKDELALAAFDYAAGLVRQRFSSVANHKRALDVLLGVVEVFRSYAERPPLPGGCPILNTAIDSDDTHPQLRTRARDLLVELQTILQTAAQRGIANGELRPDTDAQRLAVLIIVTLEGAIMMSRLTNNPQPLWWAADHLSEYIAAQAHPTTPDG